MFPNGHHFFLGKFDGIAILSLRTFLHKTIEKSDKLIRKQDAEVVHIGAIVAQIIILSRLSTMT